MWFKFEFLSFKVVKTRTQNEKMVNIRVRSHEKRSELKPVWNFSSVENPVRCSVTSLLVLTWIEAKWNSNRCGCHFGHETSKWNFKTTTWDSHMNKIYPKRKEWAHTPWILCLMGMCIWNSLWVLFHCGHFDTNEISFRLIKYHVNSSRN